MKLKVGNYYWINSDSLNNTCRIIKINSAMVTYQYIMGKNTFELVDYNFQALFNVSTYSPVTADFNAWLSK